MAEKKGVGHAYNVDFLNVVFAASSLFLFLSVVWMVWDDFDRDWKNTQRRFAQLEYQVTQAQLAAGRPGRRQEQARAAAGAGGGGAARASPPTRQKVDELQAQARRTPTTTLFRATLDYQYAEGDLRPGSLRLRSRARATACRAPTKRAAAPPTRRSSLAELNLAREKAEADKAAVQKQLGRVHRPGRRRSRSRSTSMSAEQTRLASGST